MSELEQTEKALLTELAELKRENRLLKEVLHHLPIQVVVVDAEDRIVMGNPRAAACLGLPHEAMEGASFSKHFPEAIQEEGITPATLSKTGTLIRCLVDGESRWVMERKISLDIRNLILFMGEDITDFKKAEKALKIRENRIKAILDTAAEGIISINEKGTIENFNPAAAHMFGYTTSEVIGCNINILMPEPYHSQHDTYLSNYLESGVPKIIGRGREVVGRRKDGSVFPLHLSVSAVQLQEGLLFTGIIRDLSEYKKMQDEVARAQHLALVGEMAATIAHEIRNPLAGISGALQVIEESLAGGPHGEILHEVLNQVIRLSQSVNDLLLFTKKWDPIREHCAVGELVNKVCKTVTMEKMFTGIRFVIDIGENLWAYFDPMLVEQILWNLIQNARDACEGEGTLTITFHNRSKFVALSIRDTGSGIEPDTLANIFKPFFTTKTQGTGLGLSITKRIMEAHGGKVAVNSELGKGTEVVLSFPKPNESPD